MMEDDSSNFNFTKTAIIIPTVSGSISFISSVLIIYVILKSPKLVFSTPYHRIMFGMSIGDCIVSLAIAMTTIPMPKDVIYPFAQPSYGNIQTCNAQAYAFIGGSGIALGMSLLLYIYYGCSLVFHMKDARFRKWIETPMVTIFAIVASTPFYNGDVMNPSPTSVWCTSRNYPDQCTNDTDPNCREGRGRERKFYVVWMSLTLATFAFLIANMCLIVFSFYRAEGKNLKALEEDDNSIVLGDREQFVEDVLMETRRDKRRITKEALMYIASFFVIWSFPVAYSTFVDKKDAFNDIPVLVALRLFFQPLQGFLNMLIFFYHKMEILKGKDKSLSLGERFKMVILRPGEALEEKRTVISNLPMIDVSNRTNSETAKKSAANGSTVADPAPSQNEAGLKSAENRSSVGDSPSQNLNLYSDIESSQEASKGTDKFQLSQGESLASSSQQSEWHYDEIRRQISNGDFSSSNESEEHQDLSFKLQSIEEEANSDDLS